MHWRVSDHRLAAVDKLGQKPGLAEDMEPDDTLAVDRLAAVDRQEWVADMQVSVPESHCGLEWS